MKYPWISKYCLEKSGVTEVLRPEWGAVCYNLNKKFFVFLGNDKEGREIMTVKLNPENGIFLRESFPDIRAGYYMNKVHWNSIDLNGCVPDDIVKKMIDESYNLVFKSLTKAEQKVITEGR